MCMGVHQYVTGHMLFMLSPFHSSEEDRQRKEKTIAQRVKQDLGCIRCSVRLVGERRMDAASSLTIFGEKWGERGIDDGGLC